MIKVSENFMILRIKKGLNKLALAKAAGVNHSVIIRAERGNAVTPKTALLICKALDCCFEDAFVLEKKAGVQLDD
jgi:DNA-binding XRE family transcriptional regulator